MVAERLGTRPVELRVGPAFAAPVTVGILRSSIVLPRDAVRWKQPTRVAVLTHEMAHVARRDVAVNALVGLATAVAWWNPVVWHVRRRLRDEAERACDDVVLRAGRSAPDYVLDLIGVARATIAEPTGTCAADLLRGDTLSRRVMHILETGRRRSPATRAAVAAAFGSAMGLAGLLGSARLVPARHASAVPPQDAAVAWRSACPYDGRGHRDRVVIRDGAPVWDVYWEGRDCEVAVTASGALASLGDRDEGSTALPFGASLLRPRAAGSSLTITIRRGADVRSIRLTYGVPSDVTDEWLAAFAVELDRHTGFAAALRFDRLWADGGFDRVLEEARTTTAGHAAAPYLIALIETRPDPVRWVRLLRVAGSRVRVRAARGRLFEAIRGMAPLDDPDVRAALDAAFPGAELPNLRAPAVGE